MFPLSYKLQLSSSLCHHNPTADYMSTQKMYSRQLESSSLTAPNLLCYAGDSKTRLCRRLAYILQGNDDALIFTRLSCFYYS